ncbi:MAG: twin-arginine translocation signal domain-containing protein [Gammaproteobacteria bacterium]|nr:twin-arginine translocation signal domain-containing protein [Gammaproteobacteria bacterium]
MIARRNLLKGSAGVSLVGSLGVWPGVAMALSGPAPESAFGFAPDRVPGSIADLCPMPSAISAAVERYSRELDRGT